MTGAGFPYRRRFRQLCLCLLSAYALSIALLNAQEPSLLYHPLDGPLTPQRAGAQGFEARHLSQSNAPDLHYWEHPSDNKNAPILLYFHGNRGALFYFTPRLNQLAAQGLHVIAMEYRGFGTAKGTPSEAALTDDAYALWEHLHTRYPHRPIWIWGYSLGSGIATDLAARIAQENPAEGLILEAPFTATVDRAAELFPWAPVHYLMNDQFLSREKIAGIQAPLFIMHGDADWVIPLHHGQALYQRARAPKKMRVYTGADHLTLNETKAYEEAIRYLSTHLPASPHP